MEERRPTLQEFLERLSRLTNDQLREVAELTRVLERRRDRELAILLGPDYLADEPAARRRAAVDACTQIMGRDGVEDAKRQVGVILAQRRPSWRGMHLHRPLMILAVASVAPAAVIVAVRPFSSDPTTTLAFAALLSLAVLAGLGTFLLPPSGADLRTVVELTAIAHAAGPSLAVEYFEQLAGGWYAVLDGGWRRRRPYRAWGCLFVGVIAVILLGVILEVTGAGK
jgi:hypothetical protein